MSDKPLYLTDNGKTLLQKAVIGKELKFSKVAFGAGEFDYETEKVADLTALKDKRVDLPLVDKKLEGGYAIITAELRNFNLETGFAAKEIGIYAIDPDTGKELLYAYRNAGDEYDFIPGGTGIVKKNLRFEYYVEIDDAPNVTFIIDYSFAHVTKEEFEKHTENDKIHAEKLDAVDVTDNFWVSDFDNNLHKIDIANTKKILLAEINKVLSKEIKARENLEEYIEVKSEIGLLEPNILMIENFKPATLIDDTKIKITSAAIGNKTLSVESLDGVKIGAEYFVSDGVNCEQVKVANVTISNAAIIINNSNYVVTLENNLVNAYDLSNCFLQRTTFCGGRATMPKQSAAWSGTEKFTGYAANVLRSSSFDLEGAKVTADGTIVNEYFTMRVKG